MASTNFGTYLGYSAGQATSCAYMNTHTPQGAAKQTYALNGVPIQQSPCITVGGDTTALRSSVGVGLIWASPMGPIRFNYAFVTSKDKYDVHAAVQLQRRRELLILSHASARARPMAAPFSYPDFFRIPILGSISA